MIRLEYGPFPPSSRKGRRMLRSSTGPHHVSVVERLVLRRTKVLTAPSSGLRAGQPGTCSVARAEVSGFEVTCSPNEVPRVARRTSVVPLVRRPSSRFQPCRKDKVADAAAPPRLTILSRFEHWRTFVRFPCFDTYPPSPAFRSGTAPRGPNRRPCEFPPNWPGESALGEKSMVITPERSSENGAPKAQRHSGAAFPATERPDQSAALFAAAGK